MSFSLSAHWRSVSVLPAANGYLLPQHFLTNSPILPETEKKRKFLPNLVLLLSARGPRQVSYNEVHF